MGSRVQEETVYAHATENLSKLPALGLQVVKFIVERVKLVRHLLHLPKDIIVVQISRLPKPAL